MSASDPHATWRGQIDRTGLIAGRRAKAQARVMRCGGSQVQAPKDLSETNFSTSIAIYQRAQAKPPVYYIAEVDVRDADGYGKEYVPRARSIILAAGGRYLAAGSATPLAGDPPKARVAILVWDNMEQLQKWFNSPEYRETRKIGEKYATYRNFAIPGLPPQ